jgi:uncharacterized protein (TIGR00661 family)
MKVMFGVFDWGLGHATRDLPIIEELLRKGHSVDIIATGRGLALLQKRFGKKCKYFDVPSVKNPYTKTRFFTVSFIRYAPEMVRSLYRSRKISEEIIRKGKYDVVISDCRYDVYDTPKNSFLINHQLRFITFAGAQRIAEKWLATRQHKYKYIIVPDFAKDDLTGELSHNLKSVDPSRVKYIGILSQLQKKAVKKDIDYFISISGPEPQRTLLEEKILPKIKHLKGKIVIALGIPEKKFVKTKKNVTIHSFLDSKQQETMMNRAKMIITRSGYTTMMELCELDVKNALLIPTPGQTEQEYLADIYTLRNQFYHVTQYDLDLVRDVALARKFSGFKQKLKTKDSVAKVMKLIGA